MRGTINSARMTLESIRTQVLLQITFFAEIAGAVAGYTAIQGDLTQKKGSQVHSKDLQKDLSRYAEIKNHTSLAGNQGEKNFYFIHNTFAH